MQSALHLIFLLPHTILLSFYVRRKGNVALDELNVNLWNTIPAKQ